MQKNTKEIKEAYIELYDAYADSVFRYCLFKTSDRDVALDLAQDSFMRVWDYLVQGKEIDNMSAFLFTVTRNLVKDWYKKKKAKPFSRFPEDMFLQIGDESSKPENLAEVEILFKSLTKLPENYQDVLVMRFVEDMQPREIASVLGEKENVISVRINRAQKKLRELHTKHE